jgi:hypothetical protein
MDLNTVQHFCLGAGAAIAFPNVSSTDYRKKFVNQNNAGDTMTAPNGSFTWLPIMPTLSFTWRNQKNAGGFILGGMYTNQQVTKTDSLENKFVYKNENVFGEICFIYYRTIIDVEDYFKAELGLMTGVTFYYLGVTPSYGIAQATQQKYLPADHYQINARYYDNGDDSYQHIMWGGPSLAISTGYKSVYLKATYTLLLGAEMPITVTDASPGGTNNTTHKTGKFGFRLDNNLGFSIGYKF